MKRYKNTNYFYKMEPCGYSVYALDGDHFKLLTQVNRFAEITEFLNRGGK